MSRPKSYFHQKALKYVLIYSCLTFPWGLYRGEPVGILLYATLLAAFILLSKRRYFPYVSKLSISSDCIIKTQFGQEWIRLDRENVTVSTIRLYKTLFVVFLVRPLEGMDIRRIAKLQREGKAILYPYLPDMAKDFPELFSELDVQA